VKIVNLIIGLIIIFLTLFFVFYPKTKMYEKNLFYMDTYINVKLFTTDEQKASEALKEINSIYKQYHELSDRYQAYHGVNNVYQINNTDEDKLKIDPKLYSLIEYGKQWHTKSNGIKNINIGNVIDVWRKYKEQNLGIPTIEELSLLDIDINNVVLLEDYYIKTNNNINLDLGSIAKGYATQQVGNYLKANNINKFLINAGGNVLVADHYKDSKYKIGLQNPLDGIGIYKVVNANNVAVVTSGGYERYFEYDGVMYNHIIDPNTLFPATKYKSVTVVTNDSDQADGISLVLFVLSIEEGKEFLKQFENTEAIWYIDENNIVKTDGFEQYE
jgi:FAD:protein FMN transferase